MSRPSPLHALHHRPPRRLVQRVALIGAIRGALHRRLPVRRRGCDRGPLRVAPRGATRGAGRRHAAAPRRAGRAEATPLLRVLRPLALAAALLGASAGAGTAGVVRAQDTSPPTVSFGYPSGTHFQSAGVSLPVRGCDNFSAVTDAFLDLDGNGLSYSQNAWTCNGLGAEFVPSTTLNPGANVLTATVCDLYGNCATASATYYLDVPVSYGVDVTPDGGSAGTVTAGSSATVSFDVHSTANAGETVALTASCTGPGQTCSLVGSQPVSLTSGEHRTVSVNVAAGANVGTITVTLTATVTNTTGFVDSGTRTLTVTTAAAVPSTVSVAIAPAVVGVGGSATATATVRDQNGQAMSGQGVTWSVSPAGIVTITPNGASAQLAGVANGQATVTATVTGTSVSGSAPLTVQSGPTGLSVSTAGLNPGVAIARDQCLTVAMGGGMAAECGDLRLAHGLPATRSFNVSRAPALLYSSAQAASRALIAADVTPQGFVPTTVAATLQISGYNSVAKTFAWGSCGTGACRVVLPADQITPELPTGVHTYTLTVTASNGSISQQASVTDSLVIVNRRSSMFGAGWWLDGLEQLVTVGSAQLWIGGDGSTRLYQPTGTAGVYTAVPQVDRPDTLRSISSGEWRRQLRGGAYVQFDALGRHVATVDPRHARTTQFWHSIGIGGSRLDSIGLPVPTGGAPLRYRFTYGVSSGRPLLATVTAPGRSAGQNAVQLQIASNGQLSRITDPDQHYVGFTYDGAGRPSARINRRGDSTFVAWDEAGLVRQVTVDLRRTASALASPADTFAVTQLCSARSASLTTCAGGVATGRPSAAVRSVLDGPRVDSADVTTFAVNGRGAPTQITDAHGQATTMTRGDSRFPALVTRLQRPNGFVTTAGYDWGGRLQADTAVAPYGGPNAVTVYGWNVALDRPTSTNPPVGPYTVLSYDAVTGDLLTQRTGPDVTRQVTYRYYTGALAGLVRAVVVGGVVRDSMEYSATMGNLVATISALGHRTTMVQDGAGRDTLIVRPIREGASPLAQQERRVYDAMDRVTQTVASAPSVPYTLTTVPTDTSAVPALTLTASTTYDAEGLPIAVTSNSSGTSEVEMPATYQYDAAGRLTYRDQGEGPRVLLYDAAGNARRTVSARGDTVVQLFDALNRLVRRTTPSRNYAQQRCFPLPDGPITGPGSGCFVVWPYFPNVGDTAYTVSGDTATFSYDVLGNVTQADNRYARIRRGYYANGQLQRDTSRLGYYSSPRLDDVARGQQYTYDLAGRLFTMQWGPGTTSYGYADTDQGQLNRVTEPSGTVFRWEYDALGRETRFTAAPASAPTTVGVEETRGYDVAGQLRWRSRQTGANGPGGLGLDSLWYDARGKVTTVAVDSRVGGLERVQLAYDGLGALLAQERSRNLGAQYDVEEFRNDAYGNVLYSRTRSSAAGDGLPQLSTYGVQGQLFNRMAAVPTPLPQGAVSENLKQEFDGAGAVKTSSVLRQDPNIPTWLAQVASRSYYDAEGRLAVVQRYEHRGSTEYGAWEEYRYDALGRRVLTKVRRPNSGQPLAGTNALCTATAGDVCSSYTERVWWAGDAILREARTADSPANPTNSGEVAYVHAPGVRGIDAPVAVRMGGVVRVLSTDWRGLGETSLFPNGAPADNTLSGGPAITLAWPSGRGAYFTPYLNDAPNSWAAHTWAGSLVEHGAGASGLLYRRNRYYDPQSGRFTQQDPIGLGGGVNLYGFAGGDPVNHSDPFGLCPICLAGAAAGTAEGAAAAGAVAAAAAAAAAYVARHAEGIGTAVGDAVDALRDKVQVKFVTYTRTNAATGQVYSGRTMGLGDPQSIVNRRAASHDARLSGFGPAVVDQWAVGAQGRAAIRGREQQLIDFHGGAQSDGGTSANLIRGVSRRNPLAGYYQNAAITMFGPLTSMP